MGPPNQSAPPPRSSGRGPARDPDAAGRARQLWLRRLVVLAVGLLLCYLCREPLLRSLASSLVVGPTAGAGGTAVIVDGDRSQEAAARLFQDRQVREVVVLGRAPGRLVREGLLPSGEERAFRRLVELGVPERHVTVIDCPAHGSWGRMRCLAGWLARHPDTSVVLLCDRFQSRKWAYVLGQVAGEDDYRRVSYVALTHRRYDETNWWRSEEGLRGCFNGVLCNLYGRFVGEDSGEWQEWDPHSNRP